MPAPTRPNSYPIWTQGNNAVRQQPTGGEQFTGFTPNFRPPAGWHNWLFGIVSDWVAWLDYATQGNGPVSNVGHNIMTGVTVQAQLDEADAFMSSLGLQYLTASSTVNPLVYTVSPLPVNSSKPLVFLDGLEEAPTTDFVWSIVAGVGKITFAVAPSAGQTVLALSLTANNPGAGGASLTGGYVVYGAYNAGLAITASGGITSTADQRAIMFVASTGGAVPITANPRISAGTKVGQELRLVGTDDTNYITLASLNGLYLNGPISLLNDVSIDLWWNGSVWVESDRSN